MNSIRENDLNRVDLNLLIVLLVLHREGSVSRAASKLHLGQPAVSGALARLREVFNDPLFVRTAKGMAPTPRAQALVTALLPVMDQMQQVIFQRPVFTPEQDQHTFRLGMSDWVERWLMPGMMADIAQMAPGVRLQVTASDPFQDGEKVQQDKVDVAISVVEQVPTGVEREVITHMGFCTMWHPLQLSLTSPLSLDVYTETDHLLVSYRGASSSSIDLILADCGRKREVRYVTPNFSSLPLMLRQIPALATVPQGLAVGWVADYGLQFADVPLEVPAFTLSLLWNKRRNNDEALRWLLEKLRTRMQGWEMFSECV